MWETIKEFFGFGFTPTQKEKRTITEIYKIEPAVIKLSELEKDIKIPLKRKKGQKKESPKKPKRHWYNNGKHNRLVSEGIQPPKGYKKGMIKNKKDK